MQESDVPTKFQLAFGTNAAGGNIRAVPVTTADPNAASESLGFPPPTLTPISGGGVAPDGRDFNGIINQMTAWCRWFSAGGPVVYDAAFQGIVGGYPKGAIVQSATTFGVMWLSTADNNVTNPDAGGAGWTLFPAVIPAGGGKLILASTTSLQLAPRDGGLLWINGLNYSIPASLLLSNSGLSASTFYYVYAFMSGATMTLEASVTGFTLASNGMPQKAGDATRTLVGAAYVTAGGLFADSGQNRLVASWFNATSKSGIGTYTTTRSVSSTPLLEINAEIRINFVVLGSREVAFGACGEAANVNASGITTALNIDGATQAESSTTTIATAGAGAGFGLYARRDTLADGLHFASLNGGVATGTGNWSGGFTPSGNAAPTVLTATILG